MDKQEQQQLIKDTVAHAKNAWGVEDSKIAGIQTGSTQTWIGHYRLDKVS